MKLFFIFYFHLILYWNGDPFAEASQYWSLTNQRKVEERPYTHPAFARTGNWQNRLDRGTFNKILHPKLRDMHRACDGQCFYAPAECINAPGLREEGNDPRHQYHCKLTASIAMHSQDKNGSLYCDYFGINDTLRETFCYHSETQKKFRENNSGREDRFYTVTLHRTLLPEVGESNNIANFYENRGGLRVENILKETSSCAKKWNELIGSRCKRTEFVAISFVRNGADTTALLHPDDLWYVCTADESGKHRITMWTNIDGSQEGDTNAINPQQILNTKPHIGSGMGVVVSKMFYNEDTLSMGCQFILQESNMTLDDPPKHAAFFWENDHRPITVKLAMGWVKRDGTTDDITRPFFAQVFPPTQPPNPDPNIFNYFYVLHGNTGPNAISPTNEILFDQLEVEVKDKSPNIAADLDLETQNLEAINRILTLCDNPRKYTDLYIACYPPNTQINCVHTGKCAAMFIVEMPRPNDSFKRIKAHIYSNLPDHKSLRKVVRPKGFVSVGFSMDDKMGRDVVVTCHANGLKDIEAYVSLNYARTNIYPGDQDLNYLIHNAKGYGSAEQNRILCSWEMETSFHINMFTYLPIYRQVISVGESEKLEYDMERFNYTLLLAAGNRNYPNGMIVYHDFRQALIEKFSKSWFYQKAGGVGRIKADPFVIAVFIALVLFFN